MLKSKLRRACCGPWQPLPWWCSGHTAHGSLAGSPAVAVFPGCFQMLCRCPLWSPRSTTLWSPGPSSPLSCRKARKGHQVLRIMASSCRCWTPPWTTEKQTNPAIRYSHELLACSLLSGHWRGFINFFPVEEFSLWTPVLDHKNSVQSFQDFQAKRPGSFVESSYQGWSLPLPPFLASPQPSTDKTSSPQAGKCLEVNLHISMGHVVCKSKRHRGRPSSSCQPDEGLRAWPKHVVGGW